MIWGQRDVLAVNENSLQLIVKMVRKGANGCHLGFDFHVDGMPL